MSGEQPTATTTVAPERSPWDFRRRALVFGLIYGFGFFIGIDLQINIYHNFTTSYVLVGAPWGDAGIHAMAILAALLTVAGFGWRAWGASYLSSGIVWSEAVRSGQLRVAGPYRYVRNPLYFGNTLMALGIGLLGPPFTTALIVIGNILFHYRLIAIEEHQLLAVHGHVYREYCKAVPRLLPRLTPAALPLAQQKPSLADGLSGEIFSTGFAVAMLYNASVTWRAPNASIGWWFVAGFVLQLAVRRMWKPITHESTS